MLNYLPTSLSVLTDTCCAACVRNTKIRRGRRKEKRWKKKRSSRIGDTERNWIGVSGFLGLFERESNAMRFFPPK